MSEEELQEAGNGHLALNGADLVDLCEAYGTPLFIFNERRLRENWREFREAFAKHSPKVAVCYSVKTNNNLALCRIMCEEGAFAAVTSSLDLHVALKAGFPPQRMILDGPHKPETLLREALRLNLLLINTESFSELELLNGLAAKEGSRPSVGLRLELSEGKSLSIPYLSSKLYCNPSSRYGFPFEEGLRVFEKARKLENINVCGIMIHPYNGIDKLLHAVRQIQKRFDVKMQFVDLGGGFTKLYNRIFITDLVKDVARQKLSMKSGLDRLRREGRSIEEESRLIASKVKSVLGHTESTLVLEPGSYIVNDAGFLAVRADLVKRVAEQNWVITDGGTNLLPDYYQRRKICIGNRASAQPEEIFNISGPLLDAYDLVAVKQLLPSVRAGDYVILSDAGAYSLSRSSQFCYPRPAAVLVRPNGKTVLIRQRETCEDVVRMDRLEGIEGLGAGNE